MEAWIWVLAITMALICPHVESYSCAECEHRRGCQVKSEGRAVYNEDLEDWIVIGEMNISRLNPSRFKQVSTLVTVPCRCIYKCDESASKTTPLSETPTISTIQPCEEQIDYINSQTQCSIDEGTWVAIDLNPTICSGYCDSPAPTTALPPCDQQFNYIVTALQCSENPEHPGYWVDVDLNPSICSGYCFYPQPIPCEEQSEYSNSMMDCNLSSGIWIPFDTNPSSCEGYCDYDQATPPTTSPTTFCNVEAQRQACIGNPKSRCKFIVIDAVACQFDCVCENKIPCEETLAADKLACLKRNDRSTRCSFSIQESPFCKGACHCKEIVRPKKHRCVRLNA